MIDRASGTIRFDHHPEAVVLPTLTRAAFLAAPVWQGRRISVQNEPWCSWKVGDLEADGRELVASFYFHGQQLRTVSLAVVDPEFGSTSWSDWSEQRELARKALHDRILRRDLGLLRRSFGWGVASSVYDSKSGGSSIVVRYE